MSRVLETVLTGRNLLSPMLATASRDVVAFNAQVAGAQEKAAVGAASSARAQQAAAGTSAAASGKAATAAATGAGVQTKAATDVGQANARTAESATASANMQARAHTRAAESATISARVQETANRSLAASNGLLGTSLTPLTAGLGAVGLGLAYAGYRGMEFDSAMSQVQAASQASVGDMRDLRDAAVDAGAKTQYSAVEAAQGITEMSKAGVSAKDVLGGGLTGALNLAAAGQISVAEAAETGATALSVFRLEGNQMSHVADLLAAGAGKAQGSVGDLSAALNQSALVANQTGLSIEDTAGALAMFASNGLIGSDAGTSFKSMLQALTPNSLAASKAMDSIGFSAYDAQGKFVGMESVAAQLRTGLAGLTEEQRNTTLETIFGSDAVRAASVLYSEGAKGVSEWTGKVDDAGYAQRQAAELTDNLRGDMERLGGAFDSVMTTIGSGAQGALREAVQALTFLVDVGGDVIGFFANLPGPVQAGIVALGAFHLLSGPVATGIKIIGFALDVMTASMAASAGPMSMLKSGASGLLGIFGGPWGLAITGAAVGLSLLVSWLGKSDDAADDAAAAQTNLAQALERTNGVIDDTVRKAAAKDLQDSGLLDWADELGIQASVMVDALLGVPGAVDAVDAAFTKYVNNSKTQIPTTTGAVVTGFSQQGFAALDAQGKFQDLSGVTSETVTKQQQLAEATGQTGAALDASTAQTQAATEAQQKLGESLANFVDPLGAYTGLLEEKKEADRKAAEATAADTESSKDSWEDYVTDVKVTFEEYIAALEGQVLAQANWQTNMLQLAGRVSAGTLAELAKMGPEGAPLVADLVTRSDAELAHFSDLTAQRSEEATNAWGAQLTAAAPVLAAIGKTAGQGVVDSLAAQLQAGTTTVAQIAAQYGLNLAGGINPVLASLGKREIDFRNGTWNGFGMAQGGVVSYYANGGMENHVAQIAPAGAMRVWAEPETGGEAYIPLASSKRDRSMNIWRETGKRLGAPEAQYFAFGGVSDVPHPPSTAPYQPPLSTAADATMQKGFDEVRAWLTENLGVAGSGAVGGAWGSLWQLVHSQIPQARMNSTFRAGDPGYHGRGKAIDFGFGAGAGGAGSAGLASINRLLHDSVGRNLAELIYDGVGDDRPDLKNGSPHTYSAGTRAEHRNHVHAAVYDQGGPLYPGLTVAYNGTGQTEWVTKAPAAMPGYGAMSGGGGGYGLGSITVAAAPVHIYLDGQEWRGMARVEATQVVVQAETLRTQRGRYNG